METIDSLDVMQYENISILKQMLICKKKIIYTMNINCENKLTICCSDTELSSGKRKVQN